MLQHLPYMAIDYSPTNSTDSINSDNERPLSSTDAGFCSRDNGVNLLRTPFDIDLLEAGHEFRENDGHYNHQRASPLQSMSIGREKEGLFLAANHPQSRMTASENGNCAQDIFLLRNPPERQTSFNEVSNHSYDYGSQFCRSDASAFTPCSTRPAGLGLSCRPTDRVLPGNISRRCVSDLPDMSLEEQLESFIDFSASSDSDRPTEGLLPRRYNSNLLSRPPADPLRRMHSDGTLHTTARWSTADELLLADYSFKDPKDKFQSPCALQQTDDSTTSTSWELPHESDRSSCAQHFNCVDSSAAKVPQQLQAVVQQRCFPDLKGGIFESTEGFDSLGGDVNTFLNNRGAGALSVVNPTGGSQLAPDSNKPSCSSEDEAWRTYLENPLTAATTAMMSIHGDEDSAAALGLLYDYYKVPREKRILTYHSSDRRDLDTRSCHGQLEMDSASGTLSDEVTLLSPVSTVSNSRTSCSRSDSLLREVAADGVASPAPHVTSASDVEASRNNALGLNDAACDVVRSVEGPLFSAYASQQESRSSTQSFAECDARINGPSANLPPASFMGFSADNASNFVLSPNSGGTLLKSPGMTNAFSAANLVQTDQISSDFEYTMEAPKSLKQKDGEPIMSYINKGQFYCITLRQNGGRSKMTSGRVTSVVQVVFGDGKPEEEQLRHWKYWHQRQHTAKQRIIDIADYKESYMVRDVEELAHNAISFKWDVSEPAKIFVSCNCLSTDFSAQKGIKGLPLLLQIDTFLDDRLSAIPAHRGICQLKVFCDKGAERKIRDEERKNLRKKQKAAAGVNSATARLPAAPIELKPAPAIKQGAASASNSLTQASSTHNATTAHKRLDIVYFRSVADRATPAVHFVPDISVGSNRVQHVTMSPCERTTDGLIGGLLLPAGGADFDPIFGNSQGDGIDMVRGAAKRSLSMVSSEDGEPPSSKLPRLTDADASQRVLLYVRRENENVYDGVMLREPTLRGLKEALEEKYNIPAEKITKVLKKSRKGILVNVDDNIVRHYSNEDTFCLDFTDEGTEGAASYKVTLTVV